MNKSSDTKARLLDAMGDHVLANGLTGASLRPLAKAAGTSDRMLIYHFGSKEGLIAALLEHLAERMADVMEAAVPGRFGSWHEAAVLLVAALRQPPFDRYMRVWLEISAAAARGEDGFADVGHGMMAFYRAWLAERLPEGTDAGDVALMLTLIEGTVVLDSVGQGGVADAALDRLRGR